MFVGEGWLFFGLAPHAFGYCLVGRPDVLAIERFVSFLDNEGRVDRAPHGLIADLRHVSGIDHHVFALVADYIQRCQVGLSRWVTKAVLVPPSMEAGPAFGLDAAAVTGFFRVVTPPFPVEVATTLHEALEHVGMDSSWGEHIDEAVASMRALEGVRSSLRAYLSQNLVRAEVGEAARAIGVSTRTLQRRLSPHGFDSELARARVERARQLLPTPQSLLAIAIAVGFSSTQALNAAFQRVHGLSPSAWRLRAEREK